MVLAVAAGRASARMIYEGFDYAAGSNLSSYSGTTNPGMVNPYGPTWQTAGSTAATDFIQVSTPGLAVGSVGGVGNSAQWGGDGSGGGAASRLPIGPYFAPVSGGYSMYYSAAIQVTNYANLWDQTSGSTGAGLNNRGLVLGFNTVGPQQTGVPSVAGARLFIRQGSTPDTFQFGFSKNSNTAGQFVFENVDRPLFDASNNPITYFVVGMYTLKNRGTSTDDDAAIWINPDPATFSGTPSVPTFSTLSLGTGAFQPGADGADLSTASIQSFLMMQKGQAGQASGVVVDELRIDNRWSGVTPVRGTTYTGGAAGTWSDGSNWSGGAAPSAAGATVNLPQQAAAATVTLTSAQTVGKLNLSSSNGYTLNGAGPLTFSGDATINATAGAHTIAVPVSVATSLNVDTATSASLTVTSDMTYAPGATLTKAGGGTLTVKNVRADAVMVIGQGSTLQVAPDGTNAGVSVVKSLSIPTVTSSASGNPQLAPTSKLDLTNNALVYDYTGNSPLTNSLSDGSAPRVLDLLNYGYNAGAWNGTGITSSTAASDPKKVTTIGYAEASVLRGLAAGQTATFMGQTVDSTSLILRVTKYGDVNLDGVIDGDDYAVLDRSFALGTFVSSGARWTDGDFNMDFKVDQNDYLLIDKSLGVQGGILSPDLLAERRSEFGDRYVAELVAAVPEPISGGLVGLVGVTYLSSRRRHQVRT